MEIRTPIEVHRWIDEHDRDHALLVDTRVYDAHAAAQERRLTRIEESIRWVFRLALTQAVALIIALVVAFASRGGP